MRGLSLLLLVLSGCGGRDPLFGVEEAPTPPATGPDASVSPGTGGSPGNTAGISGTAGSPGAGGTPGTGGSPGTKPPPPMPDAGAVPPPIPRDAAPPADAAPSPGACQFPKCLAAVMATCPAAGKCVQQLFMNGGGVGSNACYANGVKVISSLTGGRNQRGSVKVFKADGTLCYTVEPEQRGGGVNAVLYRDASGQSIASATVDRNTLSVACAGTTTPQSVAMSCQPGLNGNAGCTMGMCSQ